LRADVSRDNKYLAAEKIFSSAITLWDINTKKELRTLPGLKSQITKVSFSHCSKFVGVSCKDGKIIIWEVKSGREIESIDKPEETLNERLAAQKKHAEQATDGEPLPAK